MAKHNRKKVQSRVDIIIRGLRFILDMSIGPRRDVPKFIRPAPKLSHSATSGDIPARRNMDIE